MGPLNSLLDCLRRKRSLRFLLITGMIAVFYMIRGFFVSRSGDIKSAQNIAYGIVKRVIDGDTIVLTTGIHVRYIGIDTPETRYKADGAWIYDPEPYAKEAKDFNEALVGGERVRLEFDEQKRDRYDRLLAYVYLEDGTFVNAELLKNGYAIILSIPPNRRYATLFELLENRAHEQKKGLWQKAG